jgi:hypothetical protein
MVYVLKNIQEWDGTTCKVTLYTREDNVIEAFKTAVLEDISDHNWNENHIQQKIDSERLYKELTESEYGELEEENNYKMYFYRGPNRSYEYCDYVNSYDTCITLIQLTPED